MNTWQRILTFGVALVAVFGVAIGIGRLAGPIEADSSEEHGHDGERVHLEPAAAGYELALEQDVLESGRPEVAFRVLDEKGEPLTSYDVEHEKRLHLIAVRRDLAEFRHVHPRLDRATGRWSTPIDLDAGAWRLYADFLPAGGEATLAEADLMVGGEFAPKELGPDTETSTVDGFEVHLDRDPETSMVTLHVTRDGQEVTDLQPYLGSYGHLVAIRADDLYTLAVVYSTTPSGLIEKLEDFGVLVHDLQAFFASAARLSRSRGPTRPSRRRRGRRSRTTCRPRSRSAAPRASPP